MAEDLNKIHILSAEELCWCGQSHANVVQRGGQNTLHYTTGPDMTYTTTDRTADGYPARRWHYDHIPGDDCTDRCVTVVWAPKGALAGSAASVKPPPAVPELAPERTCPMCTLGEFHAAFRGPVVEEGPAAGMCQGCAEYWTEVQLPAADAWIDGAQRRGNWIRTAVGLVCAAFALLTLGLLPMKGHTDLDTLGMISGLIAWWQVMRIRQVELSRRARRERHRDR